MKFLTEFEKTDTGTYNTTLVPPTDEHSAVHLSTTTIIHYLANLSKPERLSVLSNLRMTYCHLCGGVRPCHGRGADCHCAQIAAQIPDLWPADIIPPEKKP